MSKRLRKLVRKLRKASWECTVKARDDDPPGVQAMNVGRAEAYRIAAEWLQKRKNR